MMAYSIEYKVRGKRGTDYTYNVLIDARDMKSAKRKLARKHGYKDGRMIQVMRSCVIGYY